MVLGDKVMFHWKVKTISLFLWFLISLGVNAQTSLEGIDIPSKGEYLPLELSIPISKSHFITLTIWGQNGNCIGWIGRDFKIDFNLPATCDIMTFGAAGYGFKPLVRYNEKSDKPTIVRFQIVGALKYYPSLRAECSDQWRNVELRWPGPTVHLTPIGNKIDPKTDALHCPRFYVEQKPSGLP
jgi:hypothetical protein